MRTIFGELNSRTENKKEYYDIFFSKFPKQKDFMLESHLQIKHRKAINYSHPQYFYQENIFKLVKKTIYLKRHSNFVYCKLYNFAL